MNAKLLRHLCSSPIARAAFARECRTVFLSIVVFVAASVGYRYWRGQPTVEDAAEIALGVATILLVWLIALIRTVRATLREHGLLER